MKINDFKLEVYFGNHEFTAPYLLAQSDCESMTVKELLAMEPGSEEAFLNGSLGYTEVAGDPDLRAEIAKLYDNLIPDEVIVHVGAQEPIFNAMNVILDPEDHVISQFPVYQSLYEVAKAIGCQVSKWFIKQTDVGWQMDFRELETLIRPNTKLICINNPNNPTGFIFSVSEMEQLVALAKKHGIYILSDEVYKGLELDGEKRPWMADIYDRAVSIGVMSKAYGLPGLRIGWTATKNQAIHDKLIKMKHYTSICSSSTSEFLATVALKHSDEILEKSKTLIENNLKLADDFFADFPTIFRHNRPMAGSVAFNQLKIDLGADDFCEKMVADAGILILSSSVYDYEGKYFRMGYGRRDFEVNLKRFEAYLLAEGYDMK